MAGTLFVAIAVWLVVNAGQKPAEEPVVNGEPMGHWLQQMIATGGKSDEARAAAREAGADAVPFLVEKLTEGSTSQKRIELKQKLPLFIQQRLPRITFTNWQQRIASIQLLGEIGPAASNAVPALINALDKKEPVELLGRKPSSAGNTYMSHPVAEAEATRALGKIAPNDRQLMECLMDSLGQKFFNLRWSKVPATLELLTNLSPEHAYKIPAILQALQRHRAKGHISGYDKLYGNARIGMWIDNHYADFLIKTLAHTNPAIRASAASDIAYMPTRIPKAEGRTLPALHAALTDDAAEVRLAAAEAIQKVNSEHLKAALPVAINASGTVLPVVIQLLESKDAYIRLRAVEVLRKMGQRAKEAVPQLRTLLEDEASIVRVWAEHSLKEIEAAPSRP